ncbi:hypothetical protein GCM10011608_01840 [Micromonospora sonchi]|uniref:Uncharacterized protein n=1 Tax=Micromonospora sonchi TaxID=1763543 RepID=A0A917WQK1_9ACTN|nr:hypothetical protein GCM10011608_01840 [Micromonospora sonchi]
MIKADIEEQGWAVVIGLARARGPHAEGRKELPAGGVARGVFLLEVAVWGVMIYEHGVMGAVEKYLQDAGVLPPASYCQVDPMACIA